MAERIKFLDEATYRLDHEAYESKYGKKTIFRAIDGAICKDAKSTMKEIGLALEFPDYYGQNWDALDECINDLEWLKGDGYVIAFFNASQVLRASEDDFKKFASIIEKTARSWSESVPQGEDWRWTREPLPFQVLFVDDADLLGKFKERFSQVTSV